MSDLRVLPSGRSFSMELLKSDYRLMLKGIYRKDAADIVKRWISCVDPDEDYGGVFGTISSWIQRGPKTEYWGDYSRLVSRVILGSHVSPLFQIPDDLSTAAYAPDVTPEIISELNEYANEISPRPLSHRDLKLDGELSFPISLEEFADRVSEECGVPRPKGKIDLTRLFPEALE